MELKKDDEDTDASRQAGKASDAEKLVERELRRLGRAGEAAEQPPTSVEEADPALTIEIKIPFQRTHEPELKPKLEINPSQRARKASANAARHVFRGFRAPGAVERAVAAATDGINLADVEVEWIAERTEALAAMIAGRGGDIMHLLPIDGAKGVLDGAIVGGGNGVVGLFHLDFGPLRLDRPLGQRPPR